MSPRLVLLLSAAGLSGTLWSQEPTQTVTIKALEAQMKYEPASFQAKPGARIKLIFENHDGMPHNLVVCKAGDDKGMEVALAAWALGDQGLAKDWIPNHPRIIAHTKMVQPKQREELIFTLPSAPGVYPYVCTFPGHAQLMNGIMDARTAGGSLTNVQVDFYSGTWSQLPDFSKMKPARTDPSKDNKIDVSRDTFVPSKNNYALVYRGDLTVLKDGDYQFFLASDDGSRILVDDKIVVNFDGVHGAAEIRTGGARLTAGKHAFRLEYFENSGEEQCYAAWKGPGMKETPLSNWVPEDRQGGGVGPSGNEFVLGPENGEAVIYRNFIEGASPRGLAVGFPGGFNLLWDANIGNMVIMWRGAFLNVKQHWTDRGGGNIAPKGYNKVRLADGVAIARLETNDAPWPGVQGNREKDLEYRGYRLDAKRFPAFGWKHSGTGVSVLESFAVSGSAEPGENIQATRTLDITGTGDRLFLRAATGGTAEEKDGWIVIDNQYRVKAQNAQVRMSGNRREVLIPVVFTGGKTSIKVTYAWLD